LVLHRCSHAPVPSHHEAVPLCQRRQPCAHFSLPWSKARSEEIKKWNEKQR
jgi:hypothetical protein